MANKKWQGYSASTTDAEAQAAFVEKFKREPAELIRTGGGVNVGPLQKGETNHE